MKKELDDMKQRYDKINESLDTKHSHQKMRTSELKGIKLERNEMI